MRAVFTDPDGRYIGTVETDSELLLLAIERRVLGTALPDDDSPEEVTVWSASVFDDNGTFCMEATPANLHREPR